MPNCKGHSAIGRTFKGNRMVANSVGGKLANPTPHRNFARALSVLPRFAMKVPISSVLAALAALLLAGCYAVPVTGRHAVNLVDDK